MKKLINKIFSIFAVLMIAVSTATAQTTSTITVGGTDYTLFTGFTATGGAEPLNIAYVYGNAVDGNTSTSFHTSTSPAYVEFNTDDPIIPKGYIFNTYQAGDFYPQTWVLKAKADATDDWTELSSYSGQTLSGQEFQYACSNDDNTAYKYFRFEASNSNNNIWLTEIRLYGFENLTYTHLTEKAATCTEVGIMQECYKRGDGKYFTDETGTTELDESDVIVPMIAHTGVHHEADEDHIEYWQCSVCSKYFSNKGCTTEIIKAQTFIVKYLDDNGVLTTLNSDATMVSSTTTSWPDGWYIVYDDVTIADRITVSGTVNLILCDGATLTASKGITVGSDATLNIYAQTDDEATMGALVASGANDNQQYNAGIGGVDNTAAGTITINGGKINAIGHVGAGIGSGGGTSTVGTITINGGFVTAQDGSGGGAGIGGGGWGGQVGTINLNGGIIHAAGIGSGSYGGDCSITVNISDGVKKIVATPVLGGACIGSGEKARGSVTVNFKSGGNVVTGDAKDAVFYDTGEGSQRQVRAKAMNHHVTMNNDLKANITVNPEYALAGETVTLTFGTTVDATTLNVKNGTNDLTLTDAGNRQYTFTMPDGDVTVTATLLQTYVINLPANMEVVSATNAADADGKYITGTTVTFKPMFGYEASNVSDGTTTLEPDANGIYTVTVADADVTVTATVGRSATIDLSDANGDFNAIDGDVLTGSTSHTLTIADGASITLSGATITGGIVTGGSATITLVGTNSTTGAQYKAGIQIGGSGTTLTINGDGTLTANGGTDAAGIGLNRAWNVTEDVVGGNIVINGGTITANGGTGGAGIGAGVTKDLNNSSSRKAIVGNITIAGGSVTAVGGSNADGIGAGQNNFNATIQIGTVTIYDAIEMVDASSIKDFASVVYMHGDDVVTASKTDYFTISENGDRRIIVPKDDTDYTITIADGIEHGTLTVAATAKYMETVTVTATPAFGYRFVRLVVKDAQNNDVASTNNTFQMPKGGAIVSAEFALGSHGTTEFTWYDVYNDDCETIYDGVTTVSIQTGSPYYFWKNDEDTELGFLLDNDDTREANIPYAGGTGEFYEAVGTNFSIPNNGETGYYDITLTDVGNGKWGVSILPTAAQMDVVSDQTYTGSAITPEPLVIAGSLSLTKGIDYTYSYTNNINAGTATVRATFQGDYAGLGYVEKEFTIAKATPTVTSPTAAELTYTGSAQALVKAGTTDHGTLLYSLDGTTYSAEIPTATDAAEYMVYYKVDEQNYYAEGGNVKATIAPKVTTLGALKITENQDGKSAVIDGNYNETSVAYTLESNIENVTVTFNRTFTNDATSTIVLPFGIEEGGYSGGDFFEFTDMDTKTWTATMSKVTSVKAHTPYLFVPSGETLTISQKVKLEATSSTTVASDAKNGWTFTGVYQKKVWDGNDGENKDYCFAANTTSDGVSPGDFVKIGTYVQVRAFRCYLTNSTLSKSNTDLPEKITIRLVDETSAVVTPDDPDPLNPDDSGDITTPVSEIAPNIGTKVWSYDRTIFIEAQSGTDYQIFDLSGRTLLSGATNSTREEITLGRATGIVIVKINGKSFKVNY